MADEFDTKNIEDEIIKWKGSPERLLQIKGQLYYQNEHDILKRRRLAIGEGGKLREIDNIPCNKLIDNQYSKMVNQKVNYLLGKPFTMECKNEKYIEQLKNIFDKRFMRLLKNAGKSALNNGVAWLYPYYDTHGDFRFRLFPGYEILPFWTDSEHNELRGAVRLYSVTERDGLSTKIVEKVEIFGKGGIRCYILDGGILRADSASEQDCAYVMCGDIPLNWERIPLIPIKYNDQEIPLIKKVKSLQDGINEMISEFTDNMQEDSRNTILVLKNYDGENLSEFRQNLVAFGAVKVNTVDGHDGGVDALKVEVNSENYKAILALMKKALIENAMGYDAKDDRLSGNPNQMNIQSMYSDIDLDANDMETELQAAFQDILWFADAHLKNIGRGDFSSENVNFIFNRDILINESEAISNCAASAGILSDKTIIAQHPWVNDPQEELERVEEQNSDTSDYDFGVK